jgi:hypothetical protein
MHTHELGVDILARPRATTKDMGGPEEGAAAVALAVLASAFVALLGFVTVCAEQHACLEAGTCYAASNSSYSCAFKTSITPAGWRMLNTTDQEASLQSMTRGVCAPGLRQSVDPFSGDVQCVRKRSYPDALNLEIAAAGASLDADKDATDPHASDHRRWCGRWIDARRIDLGQEKWAFYDEQDVAWDVDDVILAKGSARLGGSDVAKFRAACRSMVASDAAGPAGAIAFDYLSALVTPAPADASFEAALASLGVLASHSCDAPLALGLDFGTGGRGFAVSVGAGVEVSGEALREVLYAVGAGPVERDAAAAFADEMASVPLVQAVARPITLAEAQTAHLGALAATWVAPLVTGAALSANPHSMRYDATNAALARFAQTFGESAAEGGGAANARAYLRGLAAYCAYASGSVVSGGAMGALGGHTASAATSIRAQRPQAAALGRLRSPVDARMRRPVARADVYAATSVTWSQLGAVELATATRGRARSTCLRAARVAFPDAFDALAFNALVTPRLYAALGEAVPVLRAAAKEALEAPPMAAFYATDAARTKAVGVLDGAKVRIAGAARGSWGGATREFVRPELTSDDGALLMLLKQAHAVHLDRVHRVVRGDSLCEHPPLFDGLERNAYMLLWEDVGCVVFMPGILVPPFADERFDTPSLYGRIGFVIAHELMHATAINKDDWNMTHVDYVLRDYRGEHFTEAIADVGAVAALERTTVLSSRALCAHVSQLFCARVGWIDAGSTAVSGTHPSGNARGDNACAFLREHF